jgi:hypothetical protein
MDSIRLVLGWQWEMRDESLGRWIGTHGIAQNLLAILAGESPNYLYINY